MAYEDELVYTHTARNDLRAIYEYVAHTLQVTKTAPALTERIMAEVRTLENYPERGVSLMTVGEARTVAIQKYIELWGADWVSAHSDTIGSEWSTTLKPGYLYLSIVEDISNRRLTSDMSFDTFFASLSTIHSQPEDFSFKGRHRTSMFVNLSSGAVTVDEHF